MPPKPSSTLLSKALDGCHRFGWLISPAITLLMLAYFFGGLNQKVESLSGRMATNEAIVTQVLLRLMRQ